MATIKGQNLRIAISGEHEGEAARFIAKAQQCTIHLQAQVEEASTKDDTDQWAVNEVTGFSGDISTDALIALLDEKETDDTGAYLTDLTIGQQYTLEIDFTGGTQNRQYAAGSGGNQWMKVKAHLTDLSLNAGNRQNSTYTAQFTFNGEPILTNDSPKPYTPAAAKTAADA